MRTGRSAAVAGNTTAAAATMAATAMATAMARATIWTRAPKAPYARGDADPAAANPGRNDRRNDCMHDTSGSRLAPAIALTGVNLSLGRGAARVHILKDIDLHIGRGETIRFIGPSGPRLADVEGLLAAEGCKVGRQRRGDVR